MIIEVAEKTNPGTSRLVWQGTGLVSVEIQVASNKLMRVKFFRNFMVIALSFFAKRNVTTQAQGEK